jgi:hypothetical protein
MIQTLNAKSLIGKTVNLHLKDGCTIVNVKVLHVINQKLTYKAAKPNNLFMKKPLPFSIPITQIKYIEPIQLYPEIT